MSEHYALGGGSGGSTGFSGAPVAMDADQIAGKIAAHDQAMRSFDEQMRPVASFVAYMLAQANYQPLVHVPSGWRDWYACGDELH